MISFGHFLINPFNVTVVNCEDKLDGSVLVELYFVGSESPFSHCFQNDAECDTFLNDLVNTVDPLGSSEEDFE